MKLVRTAAKDVRRFADRFLAERVGEAIEIYDKLARRVIAKGFATWDSAETYLRAITDLDVAAVDRRRFGRAGRSEVKL